MSGYRRQLWRQFWAIAKPYWFSEEKWGAIGLLLILFLLLLLRAGLLALIVIQGGEIVSALASGEADRFWQAVLIFFGVVVVVVPVFSVYAYLPSKLANYWRRWLTHHLLNQYFKRQNFYQISYHPEIDNPDQRIAEDIKTFTQESLKFLVLILDSLLQLIAFAGVLWSISKSLMVFLIVYSFAGTILTAVVFGKVLIGINLEQLKKEANFRFGLVRIRENAEAIAFYGGEAQESEEVQQRFWEAFRNFKSLIRWQLNLNLFQTGYQSLTFLVPGIMLAPQIFSGALEVGAVTQAGAAFRSILSALALIITQFQQLSALAAAVSRLETFTRFTEAQKQGASKIGTTINVKENSHLALRNLTLQTPNYRNTLIKDLSVVVPPGQGLLIVGASGVGKSSLLRALAGLWQSGTGTIVLPTERMLFLPQRPYTILGSLRQQLLYPEQELETTDEQLLQILEKVNLLTLTPKFGGLDGIEDWSKVLSIGEQQRLAFARLLLYQPKYAILDEATSALDVKNEELLYRQLQETAITFVSVGHRPTLLKYHQQILELSSDRTWRLSSVADYRSNY